MGSSRCRRCRSTSCDDCDVFACSYCVFCASEYKLQRKAGRAAAAAAAADAAAAAQVRLCCCRLSLIHSFASSLPLSQLLYRGVPHTTVLLTIPCWSGFICLNPEARKSAASLPTKRSRDSNHTSYVSIPQQLLNEFRTFHLQAREAAASLPAKRSRDGRPRRAAAARRKSSYDEDEDYYTSAAATAPLDALAAVGAATTEAAAAAADEARGGNGSGARGRSPPGIPQLRAGGTEWPQPSARCA